MMNLYYRECTKSVNRQIFLKINSTLINLIDKNNKNE